MTFPSVPSPSTWSSEQVVTAPQLRSDVSNAVAFLVSPPMFVGQQTQLKQSIPNATTTGVMLDTELFDNWNGHSDGDNPQAYYGMVQGWYLCECTIPLNASTTGLQAALICGVQNQGALTTYGGGLEGYSASFAYQNAAAMLMEQVGTLDGASNDYIYAGAWQNNSGASNQPLSNTTGAYPWLNCRWVSAISGTEPLSVPANAAFPAPPALLGHTFMNTNIRDTIRFLTYPPVMEAFYTGGGTFPSESTIPTVGTTTPLGSKTVDNYSAFSTSTYTWTAPVAGLYYAYGCVSGVASAHGSNLAAGITVTSANYNSGTQITLWGGAIAVVVSETNAAIVRKRLRLNAGDTVQLGSFQYDTVNPDITWGAAPWESRLIMVWMAA
jgi:hypothetical protein